MSQWKHCLPQEVLLQCNSSKMDTEHGLFGTHFVNNATFEIVRSVICLLNMMLSDRMQTQNSACHMISFICGSRIEKNLIMKKIFFKEMIAA